MFTTLVIGERVPTFGSKVPILHAQLICMGGTHDEDDDKNWQSLITVTARLLNSGKLTASSKGSFSVSRARQVNIHERSEMDHSTVDPNSRHKFTGSI